jgi:hypothetical protein
MAKSLSIFLLIGKELNREEKLFTTSTITQKVISLVGFGSKKQQDLNTLTFGILNQLVQHPESCLITLRLIISINISTGNGKNKIDVKLL